MMFRSPIHRRGALTAALVAGYVGIVWAQSPAQQTALAVLSDSLRSAITVENLGQISPTWNHQVPHVMKELRKALYWLRQGELEYNQDLFDRALDQFEWATASATDWPYPRYGMALSLFGMKRYGFQDREVTQKTMADGGQTVVLNPLNTYYPNGTATLFYVVDGLVPGNAYRTTIALQRWDDDEDIISLSFEETAAAQREYRRRDLVLTDLDAGRCRVRLTLLDVASNRTVIQEQVINLLDRAR